MVIIIGKFSLVISLQTWLNSILKSRMTIIQFMEGVYGKEEYQMKDMYEIYMKYTW